MSLRIASLRTIQQSSLRLQARFASTEASKAGEKAKSAISKVSSTLSTITTKAVKTAEYASKISSIVLEKTIYGAKVGAEVAKEVYKKENMAPPTVEEFKQAAEEMIVLAKTTDYTKISRVDLYKAAYCGAQVYGFFLVGEIVGRLNICGYGI